MELFTEKITAAAREAIPPHRGGKNLPRVPWFNEECKQAILDRKRAQRKYFKHPTLLNFINFKKAKAKSKFIIKQSKASSWRHYVSTINSHTSTKSVWKKIRKIKGKDTTPKTHLKKNTILISDPKEQANYLAESFSKNSSSQNYSNSFQKICTAWQTLWNDETRNKLYEIRPNLKESLCNTTQPLYRRQETVMTRLRIGHTWITHSYLLKKEDQPFCHACDNPFTVKHILVECSDFTYIRNKYYTTTDVHTLFREVDSSKITEYLKEIKLFDKI